MSQQQQLLQQERTVSQILRIHGKKFRQVLRRYSDGYVSLVEAESHVIMLLWVVDDQDIIIIYIARSNIILFTYYLDVNLSINDCYEPTEHKLSWSGSFILVSRLRSNNNLISLIELPIRLFHVMKKNRTISERMPSDYIKTCWSWFTD